MLMRRDRLIGRKGIFNECALFLNSFHLRRVNDCYRHPLVQFRDRKLQRGEMFIRNKLDGLRRRRSFIVLPADQLYDFAFGLILVGAEYSDKCRTSVPVPDAIDVNLFQDFQPAAENGFGEYVWGVLVIAELEMRLQAGKPVALLKQLASVNFLALLAGQTV